MGVRLGATLTTIPLSTSVDTSPKEGGGSYPEALLPPNGKGGVLM